MWVFSRRMHTGEGDLQLNSDLILDFLILN